MTNSQIKAIDKLKKDYHFAQCIDILEKRGFVIVSVIELTISSIFLIGKRGKIERIQ